MRTTINHHAIIKMMGVLLIVMGLAFILPVSVAIIYEEYFQAKCFIITMIPCFVVGFLLMRHFSPADLKMKERDGYIIVTLCWIVASLVGAAPMYISGAIPNPVNAFFEICSGFSTTGASIVPDVEALPKSILMWRSFTHWLGGMGIVVFAAALIPSIGIGGQQAASAETPGPVMTKISARFSDTAKNLYTIYVVFTVAELILLMLGGMDLFDSMIHSFGTTGTGGFSNYGASVGHFKSPYIQWVITIFMIMCGTNFNLYFLVLKGRGDAFFRDEEFRLYMFVIVTFTLLITANLMTQGNQHDLSSTFRDAAFQVASIASTTGYATANYDAWPTFSKILLMIVMITGASSSSTAGGTKFIRVLAGIKFIKRGFFMKLHPSRVKDMTINGKGVPQSVVTNMINFIFFYVAILLAGTLIVSFDGFDMVTNFSAVLTCLSNVGPGFALVGPTMNFTIFSNPVTLLLSLLMIAGRLELFTFFLIFSRHYWNSNRV